MKIALINMPFSSIAFPNLGISLLQAAAQRDGHECDLHYFNLQFAQRVGWEPYDLLACQAPQHSLVGEWVFRDALFGEQAPEQRQYLQEVLLRQFADQFTMASLLMLMKMKGEVQAFIDDCFHACDWSRYELIGFTTTFQQNIASLALAKKIKERYPQVKTVFGGANCEEEMGVELHRQFPFLDFICSGEGDLSFPELLRCLAGGQDGRGIKGIVSRGPTGETVLPPEPVWPVHDMDSLPVPDFSGFFTQFRAAGLEGKLETHAVFESSRGCWWGAKNHCTFCGLNGTTMSYRSKSPERTLAEIAELSRFSKSFISVDNILDMKYLETVVPELARSDRGYSFHYEVKVNLKKRQMKLLAEAGIKDLQPGIESLSTSILQLMRKGCTLLQNVAFLKWAAQFGIVVGWNLLYGFPGEDPREYERMAAFIPLLAHLEPPSFCARLRIDRFSPYHRDPESYGFRNKRAHPAYGHVYPFSAEVLGRVAYFFEYDYDGWLDVEGYTQKVRAAVQVWKSARGERELSVRVVGGRVLVRDSRFGEPLEYGLQPAADEVLLLCDEPRSMAALRTITGLTQERVADALADLEEKHLVLKDGNLYLSLAVLGQMDSETRVVGSEKLQALA